MGVIDYFRRVDIKIIFFFAKIFICLLLVFLMVGCTETSKVIRVIDGSTIEVIYNGRSELVKLLGVRISDSSQRYYTEARMALKDLVEGKKVRLEFENPGMEDRDKNGQLLCYVYLKKTNVNLEIIKQGFCRFFPDHGVCRMVQKFEKAESEARISNMGIWK